MKYAPLKGKKKGGQVFRKADENAKTTAGKKGNKSLTYTKK